MAGNIKGIKIEIGGDTQPKKSFKSKSQPPKKNWKH